MCTINKHGDCINDYCSCSHIHPAKPGGWLTYDVYERNICNRIIGYFINLYRKPTFYKEKELNILERRIRMSKTDELRRKYGLLEDDDTNTNDNSNKIKQD
jgi:hypothetical protein